MTNKNMKILQINTFPHKATGNIMMNIHYNLQKRGVESYVVWGRGRKPSDKYEISIEDKLGIFFHGAYTRITDKTGFASQYATKKLLKILDEIHPDIVHLHNIHGYYINVDMLFKYLRVKSIPVVWTLHDCWAFTGHCSHFDSVNCEKWITGCHYCPLKNTYPKSLLVDGSKYNWKKKKELFNNVNIHFICVSDWLLSLVKKSFLKDHPITRIYNGVDLKVFKPQGSFLRTKYHLEDKFIILGVANEWGERKGLNDFIELADLLDGYFQVVLIGLNAKQITELKDKVLGIAANKNLNTLAEWYTVADVFFNASVEETMGMTTLEAMGCGTLPIVYDATALPEIIYKTMGFIVKPHNISGIKQIVTALQSKDISTVNLHLLIEGKSKTFNNSNRNNMKEVYCEQLLQLAKKFEAGDRCSDYFNLYSKILSISPNLVDSKK